MQKSANDTSRNAAFKEFPQTLAEGAGGVSTARVLSAEEEKQQPRGRKEEEGEGKMEEGREEAEEMSPLARQKSSVRFTETLQTLDEPSKRKESTGLPTVVENAAETGTVQRGGTLDLLKKLTTTLFSVPFGFFQSRAEVRTWGEEHLVDPSVQPRYPSSAHYAWGSLPNHPQKAFVSFHPTGAGHDKTEFYSLAPKGGYRPLAGGPSLQFLPAAVTIPHMTLLKTPGYDWKNLKEYRMDTYPYTNAFMRPEDPVSMYVTGNYLVGYPYGVPAVEENEAQPVTRTLPKKSMATSWCC